MGMGPQEFWTTVTDWPDYQVSDIGRVKSLKYGKEKILSVSPNVKSGVPQVSLCRDGKRTTFSVHVLMLTSFVGPCPDGMEGCHNDGNPANNVLKNLRWDTRRENGIDAVIQRTHRHVKLRPSDIPVIWSRLRRGDSYESIATDYNVAIGTINDIRSGRTWSHRRAM